MSEVRGLQYFAAHRFDRIAPQLRHTHGFVVSAQTRKGPRPPAVVGGRMTIGSLRLWTAGAFGAVTIILWFDARPSSAALAAPSPHTSLRLAGSAYLHLYALPLGLDPGAIVGEATFDASGTRAVFVASFPWSAAFG